MQNDWLVWQLVDSAFPAGGFAHSMGLEAAVQLKKVSDQTTLTAFIKNAILQESTSSLPFVTAAYKDTSQVTELDRLRQATLTNHMSNRASKAQGRALLTTVATSFGHLNNQLKNWKQQLVVFGHCHYAPVFGLVCKELGLSLEKTQAMHLFMSLRCLISSAVRLNVIGPLAGQCLQQELSSFAEQALATASSLLPIDAYTSVPIIELIQGHHDRLYTKLFNS